MNEWQVLRQLRYLLRARTWPDGSAEKVFGDSVFVTAGPEAQAFGSVRLPLVLIRPGGGQHDPEATSDPGFLRLQVFLRLMATGHDRVGEQSLLGGNRGDAGSSAGAGLLELQEQLYATAKLLQAEDGVVVQARSESAVDAVYLEELGYVSYRDVGLEVLATVERLYQPARNLVATPITGGGVDLSWELPPDRFDRYRVLLRRAAGSTPPATITDGTGVTLSGDLATSITDAPGVGTFSYALFATYDDRSATPDSDDHVSAALTRTVTVP